MATLRDISRRFDLPLLAAAFLLSLAGLAAVYSATAGGAPFFRQLLWVALGWGALAGALAVPYRVVVRFSWAAHLLIIAALAVLAFKASSGGARRWLALGPVTFQPSEVAKVTAVLTLALLLELSGRFDGIAAYILPVVAAAAPAVLIAVEPDLGTAAVFVPILFACLYWAGAPLWHLLLLLSPLVALVVSFNLGAFAAFLAVVAVVVLIAHLRWWERAFFFAVNVVAGVATPTAWGLLKDYQRQRILSFLAPTADPRGAGYSIIQAKIALGSGRLFGKGFLAGSQVHLKFLPAGHTDFVLPAWGEEFGFIGCLLVVILFAVIVIRSFTIAYHAADRWGAVLAFGLGALFFTHFAVNAAMAVGLIPVTGLPLPFMSYGGSATVMSFAAIGLIMNVKLRREAVARQLALRGR